MNFVKEKFPLTLATRKGRLCDIRMNLDALTVHWEYAKACYGGQA
jgi:hypothetical protein